MKNLLSMKTPVLALFISLVAFGACVSNKQTQPLTDYTQLVNPFIGTILPAILIGSASAFRNGTT